MIGFAAETEQLVENAKTKLRRKGCDFIIANSVAEGTTTFGGELNEVHIVSADEVDSWPSMSKAAVARTHRSPAGDGIGQASMIPVVFNRLAHGEGLQLPAYKSEDAAGMDLVAALPATGEVVLAPGDRALIPTGLAIELPKGFEARYAPVRGWL